MKAFAQTSYRTQVRRLRLLAHKALELYPVGRIRELKFINHGENTTFRVTAAGGRKYLLRIHRDEYHKPEALNEELAWLKHLSRFKDMNVPKPVLSRARRSIEWVASEGLPTGRRVSCFHWIEGEMLARLTPESMFQIGRLLGQMQKRVPPGGVKHRRYWTAEGLLGVNAKMGSIDHLIRTTPAQQRRLTRARRMILAKLKAYERKFPRRQGLIHADLHTGNLLESRGKIAAIDFDDCGYGFYVYDLAIPLGSAANFLGTKRAARLDEFKAALIEGYRCEQTWDQHDDEILPYFRMARRLLMLGWINSRADNPKLLAALKERRTFVLKLLKKHYGI